VKRGLTQEQIATKANISIRQYRHIEHGEQVPRTKISIIIAKVLNSIVEKLFPQVFKNNIII